jgi:tRNA pseudouridine38-40 synthase
MALYQLTIAYDGTDFAGFQRQRQARTVQAEFENTLRKIGWVDESLYAAGRTDSGVHALGQVIVFDLDWHHPEETLLRALNDILPRDISVVEVKTAHKDFHPRYDAKNRQYRYQVYVSDIRNPCLERYAWRVWPRVDIVRMNLAAKVLIGHHDFSCIGVPCGKNDQMWRTIDSARWIEDDDGKAQFWIGAKSFIYHMVRRLVMITVRIGQGKLFLDDLEECINLKKELPAGIAPANGLFLEKISY